MIKHSLVIPFEPKLISSLQNYEVVVKTSNGDKIVDAYRWAHRPGLKLRNIWFTPGIPVSFVELQENWKSIPIALFTEQLGDLKIFLQKKRIFTTLNIRIFLSNSIKRNYTDLQILSSLGIHCGIYFDGKSTDWDSMNDLMHYSVYGKAGHAPVEPFHYIVSNYTTGKITNFDAMYFDDPEIFLHLDEEMNIALSSSDLAMNKFIGKGRDDLENIHENPTFLKKKQDWQQHFLQPNDCASCRSWRVCGGKFADCLELNPGCENFFTEMMNASDYHNLHNQVKMQ